MDKNDMFLDSLPAEHLSLRLSQNPYFQRQHRDYWKISGMTPSDYDLFVCTGGRARFRQGNYSCVLRKGEALLILPELPLYAEQEGDEPFCALAQHFTFSLFGQLDFFGLINFERHTAFSDWPFVLKIHNRYRRLYGKSIQPVEWNALFLLILTEFISDAYRGERTDRDRTDSFVLDMLSLIHTSFDDESVVDRAYGLSPYSRDHTTRLFRKQVGLPPLQYVIRCRLSLARDLLQRNRSVKDAAMSCGFSDQLYFSRLFKKHMGISPSDFKSQFNNG